MRRARADAGAGTAGYVSRRVERYRDGMHQRVADAVAEEVPVAMRYNGQPFAVMMVTPCDLQDFALGFSLSEGLIEHAGQLLEVSEEPRLEGIELSMRVDGDALARHAGSAGERLLPGRSGCGLCGARTLEQAVRHPPPVGKGTRIQAAALQHALAALREAQPINLATGSVHAAAWATIDGNLELVREDVGRHNALDKLIGAMVRGGRDPQRGFAVVTSRASYEMVTKAAGAGIALLAAISAPTALAIHLARDTGLTLVGFARADSHVVYSHPQRLLHVAGVQA